MKILVADDDPVCRTVATTVLQKALHETVAVPDGTAALAALLAPDAPQIAILDWMMPGLDGLEVCAKLRAANLKMRPFVIIQSARGEKADIVAGLDSGADDYLAKPVNPGELLARVRAAERMIFHQCELKNQIEAMELLIQRYNLLGEIAGRQAGQTEIAGVENPQPAQVGLPAELADGKVEAIVARTLKELGLGENRSRRILETGLHPAAEFTAWAGIILPGTNLWVDLLLEASAGDLEKLCKKSLRRAGRELEAPGVLAETHTILSAALKTRIQTRDGNAFAPLLSRVRPTQTPERPLPRILNHRSHVFAFDDCSLGLTLVASECPPRRMDPKQLQPLDILAEPVFIPGMAGVPLFTPGAVLNTRHIERLAAMALDGGDGLQVSVFQLSEIARYFYH